MVVKRCRDTRLEDTYVYGPLGDNWTDAVEEPADGNEYVPRKTDADMEPMRIWNPCGWLYDGMGGWLRC